MKNRHLTALTCASLLGSAALSQADLTIGDIVSVNIRRIGQSSANPSGAAVIGASGDSWNILSGTANTDVNPLSTLALNKVTGASSGAGLSISTGRFNASAANATNLDVYESNIFLDGNGQFGPTGPATITLTGLGAGTVIDLYLYGGAGHTSGEGATFTFGSSQSLSDANVIEAGYTLGTNYVLFSGLVADGAGTITGTWAVNGGAGQRFSSLAGLQFTVTSVPPSDPYTAWATGGELFGDDENGDGVDNGLAFLLGAADAGVNALDPILLPQVSEINGDLFLTFDCLATAARGDAVLNLQFSNDLGNTDPWTSVEVPGAIGNTTDGSVSFVATANGDLIHIVATIDSSEAPAGTLFGRLEAVKP